MARKFNPNDIRLRKLDDNFMRQFPTPYIHQLPVEFEGTVKQCEDFAKGQGYTWRRQSREMFGGYFVHPETGDCLMPT